MSLLTLPTCLQFLCPRRSLLLKLEVVILKWKVHLPAKINPTHLKCTFNATIISKFDGYDDDDDYDDNDYVESIK